MLERRLGCVWALLSIVLGSGVALMMHRSDASCDICMSQMMRADNWKRETVSLHSSVLDEWK